MTIRFAISSEVRTSLGDQCGRVLIDLDSGVVFSLNGVGAQIWTKMEEGQHLEAILDSLTRDYDIPREQLRNDLEAFVRALEKKGLVKAMTDRADGTKESTHGISA